MTSSEEKIEWPVSFVILQKLSPGFRAPHVLTRFDPDNASASNKRDDERKNKKVSKGEKMNKTPRAR